MLNNRRSKNCKLIFMIVVEPEIKMMGAPQNDEIIQIFTLLTKVRTS